MKGYFGQLARRTGLSIGNQGSVAGRSASTPGVATAAKASAPVAPIHVEEVVFTSSSPAVDSDVSASKTSVTTATSEGKHHAASVVTPNDGFTSPLEAVSPVADLEQHVSLGQPETSRDTVELPDSSLAQETAPHETQIHFVDPEPETLTTEQVFFDARPFDQSPLTVSEETSIVVSGVEELRQPQDETRDSSVSVHEVQSVEIVSPLESPNPANADVTGAPEREPRRIFQEQLKEVIAWITSPPEEVEQTTLEVIEAPHATNTVVVREREQARPAERPSKASEPHVNDLSLSIGTISIVVEEPKQDFPVSLTPAPTTHTSPQPVAPEPTRLSRYYLRNL
jgi:hypothetical protein